MMTQFAFGLSNRAIKAMFRQRIRGVTAIILPASADCCYALVLKMWQCHLTGSRALVRMPISNERLWSATWRRNKQRRDPSREFGDSAGRRCSDYAAMVIDHPVVFVAPLRLPIDVTVALRHQRGVGIGPAECPRVKSFPVLARFDARQPALLRRVSAAQSGSSGGEWVGR
jgi:hypothetical protein